MRLKTLAILAALIPGAAAAHAFLDHADPKVGSSVAAPAALRLWFTEAPVVPFCQVTVSAPAGFGGAGPVQRGGDRVLVVALKPPTPAGVYHVHWRVLSVDTHVTEGDFSFTVKP